MDRLAFEQLISTWLDDRENSDLCRQIDAACADDPACRRLVAEYEKLDSLVRHASDQPLAVDWPAFKAVVSSEIAAATQPDTAAKLDRLLQTALPAVEPQVNWQRFGRRVSQAIDQSVATRRVLRLSRWRAAALGGLAAAAALLLWFGLPPEQAPVAQPSAPPAGVVEQPLVATEQTLLPAAPEPSARPPKVTIALGEPHEMIAPPAGAAVATAAQPPAAMVRVQVHEEPGQPPALARTASRQGQRTSEPEVFFMLEPPDRTVLASAAGFGY
jgi:hypothetical protein